MTRILILVLIGVFGAVAAHAEIGAVGNPNEAKPAQSDAAPAAQDKQGTAEKPEPKPLVEITFDKNFVNYGKALNQGIAAAEKAKPDIVYNVVSYSPAPSASARQNDRMNERAQDNLRSVVDGLREQGVPSSRIRVTMKPGSGEYDAVKVFVE